MLTSDPTERWEPRDGNHPQLIRKAIKCVSVLCRIADTGVRSAMRGHRMLSDEVASRERTTPCTDPRSPISFHHLKLRTIRSHEGMTVKLRGRSSKLSSGPSSLNPDDLRTWDNRQYEQSSTPTAEKTTVPAFTETLAKSMRDSSKILLALAHSQRPCGFSMA